MTTHSLLLTAALCASLAAAELPDVSKLRPGDTLRLLAGRYEQPIVLKGLKGTKDKPIRIVADEGAVLDGTRRLRARWEPWRDGIWRAKLDFDIWQLFAGERLVYLARWPDASFEDGSIWRMTRCMRNTDHGWDRRRKRATGKTRPGVIYDIDFAVKRSAEFREGDADYRPPRRRESLAECGKDFTGALAVINGFHWITWTRPVLKHGKGSGHFTYDQMLGKVKGPCPKEFKQHVAYYLLGLAALDRPNEWWFDAKTKTAYFMPPKGQDPNTLELRGKVRDHGIVLDGCADLVFDGLRVFGQGFKLDACERVRFENCRFDYPATHRFLLGKFGPTTPWRTGYASAVSRRTCRDVTFLNCRFGYSNAPLYLAGERTRIDNCLFHDIEWDVNSSGACGSIVTGKDSGMRRCTVMRTGNSEGIRPSAEGNVIELNHLWDMGNLQHDGAAINVGTKVQARCLVARNWVHDCNRQAIRFDYSGNNVLRPDGKIYGDGVYMRNVTWNCQPSQVKGDRHLVLNNTVVNCSRYPNPASELMNMGVMGFKVMHGLNFNGHSIVRNNIAHLAHRSWAFKAKKMRDPYQIPGIVDHNVREAGAAYKYLRDPANLDFRPKPGSPLVDAGAVVRPEDVPSAIIRFKGIEFFGSAADIGACEFGAKRYWIPGCRLARASTPVPPNRARGVKPGADLMFLGGYRAVKHVLYFGESRDALQRKAILKETNILGPGPLKPGHTYYWRVDVVTQSGEAIAGTVWSFETEQ